MELQLHFQFEIFRVSILSCVLFPTNFTRGRGGDPEAQFITQFTGFHSKCYQPETTNILFSYPILFPSFEHLPKYASSFLLNLHLL